MFVINLDTSDLQDLLGLGDEIKGEMAKAGNELAAATHAHAIEEASKKLHTRRQMFVEGLHMAQEGDDTFVVSLDASVRWIDDGMEEHSMVDDLLKSPKAKTAKDGSKYMSIPFQHNKGATQSTPAQQNLLDTIKAELRKVDAPYGKLETDREGKPKLGLVRSLDIMTKPVKTHEGAGQGKGPVGAVKQGWSPDGQSGTPLLQGVRVYQKGVKNKDGTESVKKAIMTFRTVSSKHRDSGRWFHPGLEPVGIFDESAEWALKTWDERIAPKLLTKLMVELTRA